MKTLCSQRASPAPCFRDLAGSITGSLPNGAARRSRKPVAPGKHSAARGKVHQPVTSPGRGVRICPPMSRIPHQESQGTDSVMALPLSPRRGSHSTQNLPGAAPPVGLPPATGWARLQRAARAVTLFHNEHSNLETVPFSKQRSPVATGELPDSRSHDLSFRISCVKAGTMANRSPTMP
jgi:hypothetical protein